MEFKIAVVYNPEYTWEPIAVAPGYAYVDNENPAGFDRVRWVLVSSDPGAKIDNVVFDKPLFDDLTQEQPSGDWVGLNPQAGKHAGFKYTIKIGEHCLDPVLVAGRRP